ncbi:glycolate oxidase subunit GlcF [Methyloversatilis sp. NSM2]|jgi:glycolate oxidase iron-sulfur subunit|uniref:glycolate oxidase subunit GlcF n=1 Tax=Methyloversatilis sp. NSM2 TaxID=3134135 RepID=UPI0031135566
MQTGLADFIRNTPEGDAADTLLRKCVHCGFCNATCPTYQLLGDELDGPRGRIYLMKQMLEGEVPADTVLPHLDRCLTCRNCESTCPSGVRYSELVDIGRAVAERRAKRPLAQRAKRWLLREGLSRPAVFNTALALGRLAKPLLPAPLAAKVADARSAGAWPPVRHQRRMLVLAGCVQPALMPDVNAAAARVLDLLGISLVEIARAGCCGALRFHLNDQDGGRQDMRALIDAWWPAIERGDVEAIVMTASGCGSTVREYGHLLADDPLYAERAAKVAAMTRDLSEILAAERVQIEGLFAAGGTGRRPLAYHPPCSLQHGQQVRGHAEALLRAAGYDLKPVADSHLCCGSAGSYSLLQPALATTLRDNKLRSLQAEQPAGIASANVGCIAHLQTGTATPVRHWIEWLDQALNLGA